MRDRNTFRILIICTYFPPDSSIAAMRPYMLAKYLLKKGHHVTVLRAGKFSQMPDKSFQGYPQGLEIINAMGSECPVELYEQNKNSYVQHVKLGWVSEEKRETIRRIYYKLLGSFVWVKHLKECNAIFQKQKVILDRIAGRYDAVITTFGDIENIYAGLYVSGHLGRKWILDLRDPVTTPYRGFVWNFLVKKTERMAVQNANACIAVSHGLSREIYRKTGIRPKTIYNGYDGDMLREETAEMTRTDKQEAVLTFCYTGAVYADRQNAFDIFCSRLNGMIHNNRIKISQIKLIYAGNNGRLVKKILKKYGLGSMLDDRGYLSRGDVYALQNQSDIFLLLSWNTKISKGIVTGKFFEGIRSRKPVLAVIAGDEPCSELYIINKKCNYGFCYEQSRPGADAQLEQFIEQAVYQKAVKGHVSYNPKPELFHKFHYKNLTDKIEKIIKDVCVDEDSYEVQDEH